MYEDFFLLLYFFHRLQSNLSCIKNENDKSSIIESIGKSKEILEEETKVRPYKGLSRKYFVKLKILILISYIFFDHIIELRRLRISFDGRGSFVVI